MTNQSDRLRGRAEAAAASARGTGIIRQGMTFEEAVEAVRARASSMLGDRDKAMHTEPGRTSYLVGIAIKGKGSFVIQIPNAEYHPSLLLEFLGIDIPGFSQPSTPP